MKEKEVVRFDNIYADNLSIASSDYNEKEVIRQADADRGTQLGRMVLVIVIPILALIALTVVVIVQAVHVRNDAKDSQDAIHTFNQIDVIVTALGLERGSSATFLASDGQNQEARNQHEAAKKQTDDAFEQLDPWLREDWFPYTDLPKLEDVKNHLRIHRQRVNNLNPTTDENLEFYSRITKALMDEAASYIVLPEKGDIWSLVVASGSLLRASDAIGIQRGLGGTYFTLCGYNTQNFVWYSNLEGQANALRTSAFSQHPPSGDAYDEKYIDSRLEEEIEKWRNKMISETYGDECRAKDDDQKFLDSLLWFEDMTTYLNLLTDIRRALTDELNDELDDIVADAKDELIIYIVVLVIIVAVCLAVALWYSFRIYSMIGDIINHAKMSRQKSKELAFEKKKTELLLYEMLPRSVADDLKMGREIMAESFDNVTICYLDIVGFVALISRLTPMQVVQLLNALYGMFDDEIERHNVYKMEQSNDVYGVVSGVPVRTANHAGEIANLLIQLLNKIALFRIDNMPGVSIKVRAGAHSGSCAAGVVGTKTPRYSVFGEAVKMASRMSRNGEVSKIQISEDMFIALRQFGNKYQMVERGEIEIYGKGKMKTFFLQGLTVGLKVPTHDDAGVDTHF